MYTLCTVHRLNHHLQCKPLQNKASLGQKKKNTCPYLSILQSLQHTARFQFAKIHNKHRWASQSKTSNFNTAQHPCLLFPGSKQWQQTGQFKQQPFLVGASFICTTLFLHNVAMSTGACSKPTHKLRMSWKCSSLQGTQLHPCELSAPLQKASTSNALVLLLQSPYQTVQSWLEQPQWQALSLKPFRCTICSQTDFMLYSFSTSYCKSDVAWSHAQK